MDEWRKIYHNNSKLSEDARSRGWRYAMADCVATLQLGLVQWIRGDAMVILKVSRNAKRKYDDALSKWTRENQTGWGTSDSDPQAPKYKPACSVPPQPVVCPTELFMTKTKLRKVWCEGRIAPHSGHVAVR